MNKNSPRTWDKDGKPDAIVAVLTHLMLKASHEERQQCVDYDSYARELFERPDLGNIVVPDNVRLVFVREGDRDREDGGSIVIELPGPGAEPIPPYPDMMRYPTDLTGAHRDWNPLGKCEAIKDVMVYILANPHVGQYCLNNDSYVRSLFRTEGRLTMPDEVKAIFVPAGEKLSEDMGSLIIELPPIGEPPTPIPNQPNPLLEYVLCCYALW